MDLVARFPSFRGGGVAGLGVFYRRDRDRSPPMKPPSGLSRYTTNPIMLEVLLAVLVHYLLYNWKHIIANILALSVAVDYLVRLIAEPRMVKHHGVAYQAYIDTVPRWLLRWLLLPCKSQQDERLMLARGSKALTLRLPTRIKSKNINA